LNHVKVQNFMGLGQAELDFAGRGLTLIEGRNLDSPAANSNGAGKSTLFEAVYWVLFGRTKRGLTGDDIINEKAKKDCRVELSFDQYRVVRTRKDAELGTTLKLWEQKAPGEEPVDLTLGTMKDTQARLESLLGLSELTFGKVAHFGQGDVKAFASLTDAELKQVFEQALGLTCFSAYLERAKAHRTSLQAARASQAAALQELDNRRGFLTNQAKYVADTMNALALKQEDELKRLEADLSEVERLLGETLPDTAHLDERVAEVRERLAAQDKLATMRKEMAAGLSERRTASILAGETMRRLHEEVRDLLVRINSIKAKVGQPCGECRRPYTEAEIAPAQEALAGQLAAAQKHYEVASGSRKEAADKVAELEALDAELEKRLAAFADLRLELARLTEQQRIAHGEVARRAGLERRKVELWGRHGELKAQLAITYKEAEAEGVKAELTRVAVDIVNALATLAKLDGELEEAGMLVDVLGNGGLKSYAFDAVTPELNRLVNEYLAILNPDLAVEISTVSKLKSGEFREKFAICIDNAHGASHYEGSSGGERQMINLAIALAFNTLCRGLTATPVNVLFLDEPLESLDDAAAERAIELCQHFAADVENTFIIAHNPAIKDLVSSRVVVEKRGGLATLAA